MPAARQRSRSPSIACAVRASTGTDAVRWRHDQNTPYVPSPLLADGLLYVGTEGGHGVFKIKCQIKVEACRGRFSGALDGESEPHVFQG